VLWVTVRKPCKYESAKQRTYFKGLVDKTAKSGFTMKEV